MALRIDFYHLTRDRPESVVPPLAQRSLDAGQRLCVTAQDGALLGRLSDALWAWQPASFLAHGPAHGPHAAAQPIVLSETMAAPNQARWLMIADGQWDGVAGCDTFERILYFFTPDAIDSARQCWRTVSRSAEAADLNYWKQDGGKWVKGP